MQYGERFQTSVSDYSKTPQVNSSVKLLNLTTTTTIPTIPYQLFIAVVVQIVIWAVILEVAVVADVFVALSADPASLLLLLPFQSAAPFPPMTKCSASTSAAQSAWSDIFRTYVAASRRHRSYFDSDFSQSNVVLLLVLGKWSNQFLDTRNFRRFVVKVVVALVLFRVEAVFFVGILRSHELFPGTLNLQWFCCCQQLVGYSEIV